MAFPSQYQVTQKRPANDELLGRPGKRSRDASELIASLARENQESSQMWLDGDFTDLTIKCRDWTWQAHRVVLASRCQFFQVCCKEGFEEGDTQEINMDGDDPRALHTLLRYLYTTLADALYAPHKHTSYSIGFLKRMVDLYVLADKYGLPLLEELILFVLETSDLSCNQCRLTGAPPCIKATNYPDEIVLAYMAVADLPETEKFDLLRSRVLGLFVDARESFALWWTMPDWKDDEQQLWFREEMERAEKIIAANPRVAVKLFGALAHASNGMAKEKLIGKD